RAAIPTRSRGSARTTWSCCRAAGAPTSCASSTASGPAASRAPARDLSGNVGDASMAVREGSVSEDGVTTAFPALPSGTNPLLPVVPLRDVCLFPEASLGVVVTRAHALHALDVASRSGRFLLAITQRDPTAVSPNPRDVQAIGTIALAA